MNKVIGLIIAILILVTSCKQKTENKCFIKGKVYNGKCNGITITKSVYNPDTLTIFIPVNPDNSFEYEFRKQFTEKFSMIIETGNPMDYLYPINFFPDSDTIEFLIYLNGESEKNEIIGSKLSKQQFEFDKKIKEVLLNESNNPDINNDTSYTLYFQDSASVMNVNGIEHHLQNFQFNYRLDYIKNSNNEVGYSLLIEMIAAASYYKNINKDTLLALVNIYKTNFPNHTYTIIAGNRMNALLKFSNDSTFIDFQAPDSSRKVIYVSDIINNNHFTLINLWSPWCRPCLKKNKELISLYNQYKSMGFEIVGVIGGVKSVIEAKKYIISKDYPWENLIEINHKNRIWEKYNITDGGGTTILVDSSGNVLLIDSGIEEIENYLKQKK